MDCKLSKKEILEDTFNESIPKQDCHFDGELGRWGDLVGVKRSKLSTNDRACLFKEN
ncbi:hypothetical protein KA005_75680 [bacterium]|nr:hypothetical protein [bacterium]